MWPFSKRKEKDGTYWIEDGHGKKTKGWAPPDELSALLKKSGAKELVKVLIKGPWGEEVKEEYWNKEEVNVKPNEDGCIYAFCVFEDGKPSYSTIHKKLWDRFEEVLDIQADPSLSPDEKVQRLKKMTE